MAKLPKSGRTSDIAGGPFANVHSDEARRSGSLSALRAALQARTNAQAIKSGDRPVARRRNRVASVKNRPSPVQSTARTALQGSKRGSKGAKSPSRQVQISLRTCRPRSPTQRRRS